MLGRPMPKTFDKSFTQQEPLPDEAIRAAVQQLQSGRLHRYNTVDDELSEAALLEQEFATYMGQQYCLACASGGYALHIALLAAGLEEGQPVITNAFTLAPVPGAIYNAGGSLKLVEITAEYQVDLAHLKTLARESRGGFFLISHMRGHISDMEAIVEICGEHDLTLIEDCAHTMGARWNNRISGTFGKVACFSTQTYKHLNSGEGGLLTTDDPDIIARGILLSGSYMLYERHGTLPHNDIFDKIKLTTPNYSGRMDNLRAAILRPQLRRLDENCRRWNLLYERAEAALSKINRIALPERPPQEHHVGSSIQFRLDDGTPDEISRMITYCADKGVDIKWFGAGEPHGFTSSYDSWQYWQDLPDLPATRQVLATTLDLRLPLTFDVGDIDTIVEVIGEGIMQI